MLGFAAVIELLAHTGADLLADLGGVDGGVEAAADRQQPFELRQVGLDRRLHIRILQLASERRAVERVGAMHLAERSGGRRLMLEACELLLPVGAELRHHPALDESPAHRRRFALQLLQFGGIFRRQEIRNGRHQLRDLHQRALQPAERRSNRGRLAGAVARAGEHAASGIARRDAAHIGADPGVTRRAGREAVFFAVGFFAVGHTASAQAFQFRN